MTVSARVGAWLCLALLGAARTAAAMEVESAEANFEHHEYHIELSLLIDAPAARVEAVLRDYADYPSLDASILDAKVLERIDPSTILLYTKLHACSGPFCRTVNRVERVDERPLELIAVVVPEQSDVSFGRTETTLTPVAEQTRVHYDTRVTPKFWVPFLIGRPLMLRTLEDASIRLFRGVEARAKATS